MMTIRQRARPKHQTLVLKCYPRFFKSAAEIKPNSSELSYLLYYASTRRSKLQKVGAFLEHKANHDIRSGRTSNVQVTLQILTALIEKCPRDLPLYCQSVLDIINTILKYRDVQLVEDSVETFDAFCRHYDSAQLSADTAHVNLLEEIVRAYASFASQVFASRTKSVPQALRFRSAALRAIRSLVSADAFLTDVEGRKMRLVMPEILDSLYAPGKPHYMSILQYRETAKEKFEKEQTARRRQSISVGARDDQSEADPESAFGTTADADERNKEEVDLIALQSLRQICYSGRAQVRNCAREILRYVLNKAPTERLGNADDPSTALAIWATEVLENACRWTPVQDRFIILIVTMETLIRSPVRESDLPRQLYLADIIKWLLRSNINFIGLSVIDVLVGVIQRLFMLLQLHGRGTLAPLQKQQSQASPPGDKRLATPGMSATNLGSASPATDEVVQSASANRIQLLEQLQTCIGDLATHIYYSDQIGDMVSALLHRLKPTHSSTIPHVAAAVENPGGAAGAIADSVEIREKPHTDSFFSFDTARVYLLRAAKAVILIANSPRKDGTEPPIRNRVDISAWKNTQWLLRDPDGRVRKAYIDALMTWAKYEVGKGDLQIASDIKPGNQPKQSETGQSTSAGIAKRAASSASQKARAQAHAHTTFVQMIHLAVYENALQYSESDADMLLLHLLLFTLAKKLGVNAVRSGLPMMFTLQEDVFTISSWKAKVAIASLVHGYFWTLTEAFTFENSSEGKQILSEISRRQQGGLWLPGIKLPPIPLERIETPASLLTMDRPPLQPPADSTLPPYQNRQSLVECISEGYGDALLSPPSSPPTSPRAGPRRTFSTASAVLPRSTTTIPQIIKERKLPTRVKEEMLSPWSKEAIMAAAEKETARSTSLRTASASSKRNNAVATTGTFLANHSDVHLAAAVADPQLLASRPHSATYPQAGGPNQPGPHFRHLHLGGSATPLSDSSGHSVFRVSDLKRVLSGMYTPGAMRNVDGSLLEPEGRTDSIVSPSFNLSNSSLPPATPTNNKTTPRRNTATTEQVQPDDNTTTPIARRPSETGLATYAQSNVSTQALSMHTAYTIIPPSESGSGAATPPANPTANPMDDTPTGSYAHYTTSTNPNVISTTGPLTSHPTSAAEPAPAASAPVAAVTGISSTGAPTVTTTHLESITKASSSTLDPGLWTAYEGTATSPAPSEEDADIPPVPKLPASLKPAITSTNNNNISNPPVSTTATAPLVATATRPKTAEKPSTADKPATARPDTTTSRFSAFTAFGTYDPLYAHSADTTPRKRVDVSKLLSGLDEAADAAATRRAGVAAVGLGAPPF